VYSYHDFSDAQIVEQAIADIQSKAASFFFLYLSEIDSFLHMHCKEEAEIQKRLEAYDQSLRRVFEAARATDPEATMTVISDHGMTPVHRHYDVVSEILDLGFRMPQDYLSVYDSTMARFWFFNESARKSVESRLNGLECGRILPDAELEHLGILFNDRRFGETIFLLHPGWLLTRSDFNGKGWRPKGMHGYHPEDAFSDAILLSSWEPPTSLQTIMDIYPYMEAAAGLVR
jgi:predicted AlkP superfamily pyrophosphatase or phosphodiesterase